MIVNIVIDYNLSPIQESKEGQSENPWESEKELHKKVQIHRSNILMPALKTLEEYRIPCKNILAPVILDQTKINQKQNIAEEASFDMKKIQRENQNIPAFIIIPIQILPIPPEVTDYHLKKAKFAIIERVSETLDISPKQLIVYFENAGFEALADNETSAQMIIYRQV